MYRKNFVAATVCISLGLLGGCAGTPESLIVRQKDEPVILVARDESVSAKESDNVTNLRIGLKVPETYQSETSDRTGRMRLSIDAGVEVPVTSEIPVINVSQHSFDQEDIDAVTRALFGDGASVYDADDRTKRLEKPYEFEEVLIDPWAPEQGSVCQVNSFVESADGNCYRYDLTMTDAFPMKVWAKKIKDSSGSYVWQEQDSMKLLYPWVPDDSVILDRVGMTMAEAQKLADETAARLNLPGMQVSASEAVIELELGYSGVPREENMTNVGYAFHYTRNLDGVPITYTTIPGGAKTGTDSGAVRWGYEALDIYVTKDGIDEICLVDQYDIGETQECASELLSFSEVMAVFEKMMILQNADIFSDKSMDEGDFGTPPQTVHYHVDQITLGYMRIYDAQSGKRTGKLVPVWDFFGACEYSYSGEETRQFRDVNKSFLTINAMDGTVVDRWQGH